MGHEKITTGGLRILAVRPVLPSEWSGLWCFLIPLYAIAYKKNQTNICSLFTILKSII